MTLDPRSFMLISCLLGGLCAAVMFALRRSLPAGVHGTQAWGWSCVAHVIGGILLGLRGYLPEVFTILVADIFITGALALMLVALRRFGNMPVPARTLGVYMLAVTLGVAWYQFVQPAYTPRLAFHTGANALLLFACLHATLRIERRSNAERMTAAIFAFIATFTAVRAAVPALGLDTSANLYAPSALQQAYQASYAFSIIALTLGFVLMLGSRIQATLTFLATRDSMTGAYARGVLFELLAKELRRAARTDAPLALLIIDLDNFKSVNDTHGHQAGDRVIASFIEVARANLREYDLLGRYGGDEFLVVLPQTAAEEAVGVAERIRRGCLAAANQPSFTVSIGLAATQAGATAREILLGQADSSLYAAKKAGKNRVGPLPTSASHGFAQAAAAQ